MSDEIVWEVSLRLTRRQVQVLRGCLNPEMRGSRQALKRAIAELDAIEAELGRAAGRLPEPELEATP